MLGACCLTFPTLPYPLPPSPRPQYKNYLFYEAANIEKAMGTNYIAA